MCTSCTKFVHQMLKCPGSLCTTCTKERQLVHDVHKSGPFPKVSLCTTCTVMHLCHTPWLAVGLVQAISRLRTLTLTLIQAPKPLVAHRRQRKPKNRPHQRLGSAGPRPRDYFEEHIMLDTRTQEILTVSSAQHIARLT